MVINVILHLVWSNFHQIRPLSSYTYRQCIIHVLTVRQVSRANWAKISSTALNCQVYDICVSPIPWSFSVTLFQQSIKIMLNGKPNISSVYQLKSKSDRFNTKPINMIHSDILKLLVCQVTNNPSVMVLGLTLTESTVKQPCQISFMVVSLRLTSRPGTPVSNNLHHHSFPL